MQTTTTAPPRGNHLEVLFRYCDLFESELDVLDLSPLLVELTTQVDVSFLELFILLSQLYELSFFVT